MFMVSFLSNYGSFLFTTNEQIFLQPQNVEQNPLD